MSHNEVKKCFIITPIGGDNTEIRRHADGIITQVIEPILKEEFKFTEVNASHTIFTPGSINDRIINEIYDADLVVANLTYLNPNVMYEVAVRHAVGKPIIHIVCEEINSNIPFDIKDYRTIFYKNDISGTGELKKKFSSMVQEIDYSSSKKDNPIYNALGRRQIENIINLEATGDKDKIIISFMKEILDKIDRISDSNNYRSMNSVIDLRKKYEPYAGFNTMGQGYSLVMNIPMKKIDKFSELSTLHVMLQGFVDSNVPNATSYEQPIKIKIVGDFYAVYLINKLSAFKSDIIDYINSEILIDENVI